ncbi:DUF1648 domain-containing protein [Curtobacterium sp. MCJR17_020]|uniref:DUF1648 domain-containing protein n=1 Tax=Curtobacterium sp. MCJR17_020 TaxID=2175619 RepID=UPI0021AC3477|nr:DUF1648 domain-containing protein [Curtobacterium sp. MCJR17_020]WIE73489.1 DUF1648 domain-containing protein [Curtobacterium sp. MCJR17_020]
MTNRPMRSRTRVAVVAPGLVVLLTLVVAALVAAPSLPDRMAVHFGADGTADGWSSPWPVFWITLAVTAGAVALAFAALRLPDRRTAATLVLVANLFAGSLGTAWIVLAATNTVGDGTLSGWWTVPFLVVSAVIAAVPVVALVRTAPPVPAHDVEPLRIGSDTRVAWRAHIGSRWFAALGAVVVGLGIGTGLAMAPSDIGTAVASGAVSVVAGLAVLVLARVELTVDRRGMRLTSTWTRIPLMRVPLERIESCGWEDVSPGQWGGWGYRFSGRGVAYVVRSGPGLVARLRGGQARMVTVPDAAGGAAALGALLAHRTPA